MADSINVVDSVVDSVVDGVGVDPNRVTGTVGQTQTEPRKFCKKIKISDEARFLSDKFVRYKKAAVERRGTKASEEIKSTW